MRDWVQAWLGDVCHGVITLSLENVLTVVCPSPLLTHIPLNRACGLVGAKILTLFLSYWRHTYDVFGKVLFVNLPVRRRCLDFSFRR